MKRAAVLVLSLLAASTARAYTLNDVLERLRTKEKGVQAISFDFKQDIHFYDSQTSASAAGEALFGKSGQMRVAKQKPDEQVTISNGKKIWLYNPVHAQVWVGEWKDWTKNAMLPQGLIPVNKYVEDLERSFNLSLIGNTPDGASVRMRALPKQAESGYELEFIFSTDSWLPIKTIYSSGNARIETSLSRHVVNPPVSDETFRFKAPKGTEVIPLN